MISKNSHYISGRKKFDDKDFAGALVDYNRAISEEENPSLYSERGVIWYYLQDKDKSLSDMNYAVDIDAQNPYRYSSRAYIKDWIGDIEGAIQDYEKAVELDPEDSIAYNNLGLLQEKLGYADKAKSNYQRADQIAGVDELLEKIRKEQKELHDMDIQRAKTSGVSTNLEGESARQKLSIFALLRTTFGTRSGMKEYLDFIKNGFRFKWSSFSRSTGLTCFQTDRAGIDGYAQ